MCNTGRLKLWLLGMGPDRLLVPRSMYRKEGVSLNRVKVSSFRIWSKRSGGIRPVSWLYVRQRNSSLVRLPRAAGMALDSPFIARLRYLSRRSRPAKFGRLASVMLRLERKESLPS